MAGRWYKRAAFLFLLTGVAACNTANFQLSEAERRGPPPPLGTPRVGSVDGMTVGDRLMEAGEFELALSAYQRAAGENGITPEVLAAMGSANLELGRLHQAQTLLEKAVAEDETLLAGWNNLGVVLMNLAKYHQAREAFRVAFGISNGESELVRQNLILVNKLIDQQTADLPDATEFSLIRHGNGTYLLVEN